MPNEYLWYRTKIKCQEWDNKALQERLLLHFGAVDQSCKIWMNGHLVVSHVGGYLPFSCDISEYVHSGENELVIMVQVQQVVGLTREQEIFKVYIIISSL